MCRVAQRSQGKRKLDRRRRPIALEAGVFAILAHFVEFLFVAREKIAHDTAQPSGRDCHQRAFQRIEAFGSLVRPSVANSGGLFGSLSRISSVMVSSPQCCRTIYI
jgi:hypothetical protein